MVATSRRNTAGYTPVRIGTPSRSLMFLTTELSGTIGYLPPIGMLPEGLIRFADVMAETISSGDTFRARKRSGLTLISMLRALPPNGGGADTPGGVANNGRRGFK